MLFSSPFSQVKVSLSLHVWNVIEFVSTPPWVRGIVCLTACGVFSKEIKSWLFLSNYHLTSDACASKINMIIIVYLKHTGFTKKMVVPYS